jgi:hypothetical protein
MTAEEPTIGEVTEWSEELARAMLERVSAAGLPAAWVTGDRVAAPLGKHLPTT